MKNKNVGFLIIGMAIILLLIIFIFNNGMTNIVNESCSHGPSCSMYGTIKTQTYFSLVLAGLIFIIGIFLVFSKENERLIIKKIKPYGEIKPKKFNESSLKDLKSEEKDIMNMILENNGSMFQSDIVDKSGFSKVKITRILDKLEGKGFIERRRRGMTNVIILKK